MTDIVGGEHISQFCFRIDFDGPMRNDWGLSDITNYTVGGGAIGVVSIHVPTVQQAPYNPADPNPNGGKPRSVYIVLDTDPFDIAPNIHVEIANIGIGIPTDYDGNALFVNSTFVVSLETKPIEWWNADGLRVSQAFQTELPKIGKAKFGSKQPVNRSMALAMAKLADLVSGGSLSVLGAPVVGPLDAVDSLPSEGRYVGGFGPSEPIHPGIGDTLAFAGNIPVHVDRLWGVADGSNTLFRSSIAFHAFQCVILLVPPDKYETLGGQLDAADWFCPNTGTDRLIRMVRPPPYGYSLIALYVPRQSLVRIGEEILAYNESDIYARTAIICGRAQLCSKLEEHSENDIVQDVWCESFVGRLRYNLLVFGASGKSLEALSHEMGLSRTDNPTFSDTALRRAVFNTAVTNKATFATAVRAFRYVYPELWKYCLIGEDPRWPDALIVWFSSERINFDTDIYPTIEPWETWLDHIAYSDGFPFAGFYATYFRDPVGDTSYDGDHYLEDWRSDDSDWPHPIVISGPDVHLLGIPAPKIPNPWIGYIDATPIPASLDNVYREYLCRPYGLDRVLPLGCGVLILDYTLL